MIFCSIHVIVGLKFYELTFLTGTSFFVINFFGGMMKGKSKYLIHLFFALTLTVFGSMGNGFASENAKYVFYFIGDGMANAQIHAAEAYRAAIERPDEIEGSEKAKSLMMSYCPVRGMSTTFANNRFITGSAAAGTALACGRKTNINVISMSPDTTVPYTSVAELAKTKGMKVGIVSSVSIDHATPAVFYAHQPTRKMYHEIAMDLVNSDFDYFGGGGFHDDESGAGNAIETAKANGFTFAHTRSEIEGIEPGTRTIAINHTLDSSSALYYELDRPADHLSLAEFTRQGIRILDNDDGFFMMIEGGKIDWACHANDARAAIDDTIAFDDAIFEAAKFFMAHPDDTLIVVTGDHECGGMTLGFSGTSYDTAFEILSKQKVSYEEFNRTILADYVATHNPAPADIDADMWNIIYTNFGLDGNGISESEADDLTAYQLAMLEAGFDRSMGGETVNFEEEDNLLYGYYEPFTVTLTHILNQRAGIAWTSYSHTGVPVPVLAIGAQSDLFNGFYDNTDIARKVAAAMGMSLLK